jgi:hypothetical protein
VFVIYGDVQCLILKAIKATLLTSSVLYKFYFITVYSFFFFFFPQHFLATISRSRSIVGFEPKKRSFDKAIYYIDFYMFQRVPKKKKKNSKNFRRSKIIS